MSFLRTHWSKISTGLLLAAIATAGGAKAYQHFAKGDCCATGAACCHPGSPCCAGHKPAT